MKKILLYICFFYYIFANEDSALILTNSNKKTHYQINFHEYIKPLQSHKGKRYYSKYIPIDKDIYKVINQYINTYSNDINLTYIYSVLNNAFMFKKFIYNKLDYYKVPREFFFLAMVESRFIVNAKSSPGAVGLWQFMPNSVGNWMRMNSYLDERMDFWLSTEAAIEKLIYNYKKLNNDWLLALAAYNTGLYRIQSVLSRIKKEEDKNFWYLYKNRLIATETRYYIIKLIAYIYVVTNIGRYKVDLNWDKPYDWTKIKIDSTIDIEYLQKLAGIKDNSLILGNSEYKYGFITLDKKELKVPNRYLKKIKDNLKNNNNIDKRDIKHIIKYKDTLSALSNKYKVTVDIIKDYNKSINFNKLKVGQIVIIPYKEYAKSNLIVYTDIDIENIISDLINFNNEFNFKEITDKTIQKIKNDFLELFNYQAE